MPHKLNSTEFQMNVLFLASLIVTVLCGTPDWCPQRVVEVTGETPLTMRVGGQLSVRAVSESR